MTVAMRHRRSNSAPAPVTAETPTDLKFLVKNCKVWPFSQMTQPNDSMDLNGLFHRLQPIPGWWFQPLWKILVNWDEYSQYMENNKCSKPPTRFSGNGISCNHEKRWLFTVRWAYQRIAVDGQTTGLDILAFLPYGIWIHLVFSDMLVCIEGLCTLKWWTMLNLDLIYEIIHHYSSFVWGFEWFIPSKPAKLDNGIRSSKLIHLAIKSNWPFVVMFCLVSLVLQPLRILALQSRLSW